jgi:hypothetical protein
MDCELILNDVPFESGTMQEAAFEQLWIDFILSLVPAFLLPTTKYILDSFI